MIGKNDVPTERSERIHRVCPEMENKVVCYYCGTIYDESRRKCPLCGSTAVAADSPAIPPSSRRRAAQEQQRRPAQEQQRRPAQEPPRHAASKASRPSQRESGREANGAEKRQRKTSAKKMQIAALIILALAVLIVFYFIGDMIGWWPGLENRVTRDPATAAAATCEKLELSPQVLVFSAAGEKRELTVSVNLSCNETVYCSSKDDAIATIAQEAKTETGTEVKSVTFTVTAVSEGETEVLVQCGKQSATCKVLCGEEYGSEDAEAGGFTPKLNHPDAIALTQEDASILLAVTNLPEGASVTWHSSDEAIATVDSDGIVTAVGTGTAVIYAEVDGKTAKVSVHCDLNGETPTDSSAQDSSTENEGTQSNAPSGAHLEKTDVTARVGESFDLYLYDSEGRHIDDITYSVGNPSVCKVENNYVEALGTGTTTITVTYAGHEFECIVRVY